MGLEPPTHNRRARKLLRSQTCAVGLGTEKLCNVHRQSQHPRLSASQCPEEEFLMLGPSFLLVVYSKPSRSLGGDRESPSRSCWPGSQFWVETLAWIPACPCSPFIIGPFDSQQERPPVCLCWDEQLARSEHAGEGAHRYDGKATVFSLLLSLTRESSSSVMV